MQLLSRAILAIPFLLGLAGSGLGSSPTKNAQKGKEAKMTDSKDLWLEDLESPQVKAFVQELNQETMKSLGAHPKYPQIKKDIEQIIDQEKDLAAKKTATYRGKFAYQLKKDKEHVKGLWRRTSREDHQKAKATGKFDGLQWQSLINVDQASTERGLDGIDPTWKQAVYFKNDQREYTKALVYLGNSGSDASVVLEYDLQKLRWQEAQPFDLKILGKHGMTWIDENHVFVQRDDWAVHNAQNPKAPISLEQAAAKKMVSKSGYPLNVYLWKRATPFTSMVKVFAADSSSMSARVAEIPRYKMEDPADSFFLISENLNFFEARYILHSKDQAGKYVAQAMDFPVKADYMGFTDTHYFFFKLKADWKTFKADTIIAFHSRLEGQKVLIGDPESVYVPEAGRTLRYAYVDQGEQFDPADDLIIVSTIKNVVPQNYFLTFGENRQWNSKEIEDPSGLRFKDAHLWKEEGGDLYYTVNGFLMPKTEYRLTRSGEKINFEQTDQDLKTFEEKGFEVEQLWVERGKDADGKDVRVPYFIVYDPKKVNLEKNLVPVPTVISAYGGFNIPLLPVYLKYQGKFLLENGGVYVLANIRGGGEFGSRWHQSALKTNRQLSFDDLIAISEDLIRRGITSPKKLGIAGGSNGGLLMGAMLVQRPELFSAIYIAVPLLDMLRYHKLLAGASWMAEYGDPEGTERDFWLAKSPLHNLRDDRSYPKVYLQTNRFDDRVHPAHARKMANSLKKMKKDFYFFEDTKGGHGGADRSSEEQAAVSALYYAYLLERLF